MGSEKIDSGHKQAVKDYITVHPGALSTEISEATSIPIFTVAAILRELAKEGVTLHRGEKEASPGGS